MRIIKLTVNSYSHLAVDLACFYALYAFVADLGENATLYFVIYNVIAFGLQFIIGFLADEKPNFPYAAAGILILIVGLAVNSVLLLSLVLIAVGNAVFHVGGGVDALKLSRGKCADSGVFVSFGAIGVFLGTLLGKEYFPVLFVFFALFIALIAETSVALVFDSKTVEKVPVPAVYSKDLPFTAVLVFVLIAIVIRSFGGTVVKAPDMRYASLLAVSGVFIGKFIGGFLADAFKFGKVAVISLVASVAVMLIFGKNPYGYAVSMLLFNICMPITLYALYSLFPNNAGLAFGLSTLGLLVGVLPTFFVDFISYGEAIFVALSIVSAVLLLVSLKKNSKGE